MFNVRPDLRWFGFRFEPPQKQELPGFRVKPPEEEVPGFRMNADGSIREATAPIARLYPDVGRNPFDFLDRPGLGANAFTPVGDGSPPPYLTHGRRFHAGFGGAPVLDPDVVQPAGMAPFALTSSGPPPSSSPSFAGAATGGLPFGAPPAQSFLSRPTFGDGPRPSFASFSHMANPLSTSGQHSPLSFAGPILGEGLSRADAGTADAVATGALPASGGLRSASSDPTTDPNIVRVAYDEPAVDDEAQIAQAPTSPSIQNPRRGYGTIPQADIERGMTELQKKINRDQAFRELTRQPLTAEEARNALPDDWESTKPVDLVDEITRAAERHGVPVQLLARLLYQEGKFGERDKLRKPLVMHSTNPHQPIGYAQMNKITLEDLKARARLRGDTKRAQELAAYSLANREQSSDAAAEQLAYLYRLMGGSWPKAVAAYNVGPTGLKNWFDAQQNGNDKDDQKNDPRFFAARRSRNGKPIPPAEWKPTNKWTDEIPAYLRYILRGAAEDPATSDMYDYQSPRQYRARDPIPRRVVPPRRPPQNP